jgi:hypothetical protein
VSVLREVFGKDQVTVLYVKEKDFEMGQKQPDGAPCFTVMAADREGGKDHPSARKQAKAKTNGESPAVSGSLLDSAGLEP